MAFGETEQSWTDFQLPLPGVCWVALEADRVAFVAKTSSEAPSLRGCVLLPKKRNENICEAIDKHRPQHDWASLVKIPGKVVYTV